MKITQKLDLNLYHLYLTLNDLQCENYGEEINDKLRKFTNYISKKTFKDIPKGFDIIDTECIFTTYLKK